MWSPRVTSVSVTTGRPQSVTNLHHLNCEANILRYFSMDFPPVVPYKVPTSSDRLQKIKEDVIVYDGGIKNVHQDFVIVFAITFAVIVVFIVIVVILFHSIKKCKSFLKSRKVGVAVDINIIANIITVWNFSVSMVFFIQSASDLLYWGIFRVLIFQTSRLLAFYRII